MAASETYVALLPGSRRQELHLLGALFLQTAAICLQQNSQLKFIIAAANPARFQQLTSLVEQSSLPKEAIKIIQGHAQTVIAAADVVLAASGTVTLETLLIKRPLVVAYRLAPLTWWLAERLIDTPFCALPNLLAGRTLVPEFLQEQATPTALAHAVMEWLTHPERVEQLMQDYTHIHQTLRCDASQQAATAIKKLLA